MKFSKADFMLIRWDILLLCASLLVSVLILYSSDEYAVKANRDTQSAQRQLSDARNRLNTAHEDQKNMAIYADEYRTLDERKIIGDDHRLDWLEGLERIRLNNLTLDLRYSIAPQKTYIPQPAIASGNFDMHYSETKFQFDLLHEGQLLDFFFALNKHIKGQYQLEGCSIQRTAAANAEDNLTVTLASHLKAECSGGWVTLKNRNSPQ